MSAGLRHFLERGAYRALCSWEPGLAERMLMPAGHEGWWGPSSWPECTVCGDLWRPFGGSPPDSPGGFGGPPPPIR